MLTHAHHHYHAVANIQSWIFCSRLTVIAVPLSCIHQSIVIMPLSLHFRHAIVTNEPSHSSRHGRTIAVIYVRLAILSYRCSHVIIVIPALSSHYLRTVVVTPSSVLPSSFHRCVIPTAFHWCPIVVIQLSSSCFHCHSFFDITLLFHSRLSIVVISY